MSKQTSQMYGIKVKETINYAEMGDIALYYEDSLWTVKSNFENVWRDGVHYDKGDTIVTFQDGEVATFTMMGQHTDVTPYINKLYSVYSNASENPQAGDISVEYRVTNSDRPHGGYSEVYEIVIFKLVNGLIQDRKYISSEDVRKYKASCDKPVPAWNLTVDWNYTNPQSGYPMKSWVIRSNSNYIKYEEQYYKVGEDLDVFEYNDPILMAIVDETQKHETKKKVGEPPLVVVTERVDGGKPTSWSWNRENIVHDVLHTHKDVYYNGHRHKAMYLLYSKTSVAGAYKTVKSLAFAWADPYWFLVTNAEGMEYNGQILKKGQLIKAWSPGDSLNLYVKKDTAVRKPKTDIPYDNITYELLATGDTNVTVIRLVNDEEPPDSRVVVTTSDSPKVCWGIELRVEGPNWTIYSKNNFIKYNGRTYKKNKSILSFGLDEELHIEIKDEENKYYIKSSMTYHVTNEAADSVNYKVRTSKMDHNIIIEKSVNGNEEPWVRVNTYDAIIMPYDYEDLSLEFNTVNRSWVLRALSDNVYSDGIKYDTNETIAEWHYTEIKELNHIEALKDSEENIKVAVTVTGVGTEFGQDFDEFVPDDYQDFEVLHSSAKALWKVLSNSDDTWISGINYRKGDVILEVADKTFVDPFTVSVRYYDESQHAYSYRTYSISLTYSALTNKTNLIIDPSSGNPIVFNDKTVNEGDTYSITKQNAKSMYGYIWKRDMPGPGPTTIKGIMLEMQYYTGSTYYDGVYVFNLKNETSRTIANYSRVSWPPFGAPFSVQLRSFYYQNDSANYVAYINYSDDGFINDRHTVYVWGTFRRSIIYWDSMATFIIHTYIDNSHISLSKYMLAFDSMTLMETYNFNEYQFNSNHRPNGIRGKLTNGNYVGYEYERFYIFDINSLNIKEYNYGFVSPGSPSGFEELYDYIDGMYPHASGISGYDSGPHVDGYSWGTLATSDGYFWETSPYPATGFEDPDGNLIAYIKLVVGSYVTWHVEHTSRGDYWTTTNTPIGLKFLVGIKINKTNGTPSFEISSNNIILDCFDYNKYNYKGKCLGYWSYSYKSGDDMYLLIPEFDYSETGDYEPKVVHLCKYNKESCFFEQVKTITRGMEITLDEYNVPSSYKVATKTYKFIGDIIKSSSLNRTFLTSFPDYIEYLANDVPINNKQGIIIKTGTWSSNYKYFYFDNPLFNASINNKALVR